MVIVRLLPIGPVVDDDDDDVTMDDTADVDPADDEEAADDEGGCPIGVMERPLPGAASGLAVFGTVIGGNGGMAEASTIVGPGPVVAMGGINDDIFCCCPLDGAGDAAAC